MKLYFKPGSGTAPEEVEVSSIHKAKGTEAAHVYIGNPHLTPLQARLALGGWQRYEELCVAFVARTRARDCMIYLPELGQTTRATVAALFDAPPAAPQSSAQGSSQGSSQGSQDTQGSQDSQDSTSAPDADEDEAETDDDDGNLTDKKALAILGFIEMPASRAEIEKAVPVLLPRKHPDKDNSAGSTARTQAVLANSRNTLREENRSMVDPG